MRGSAAALVVVVVLLLLLLLLLPPLPLLLLPLPLLPLLPLLLLLLLTGHASRPFEKQSKRTVLCCSVFACMRERVNTHACVYVHTHVVPPAGTQDDPPS